MSFSTNITAPANIDLDSAQTIENKTLETPIIDGTVSGTAILNEPDMISNSAFHLATQQSIKSYLDSISEGLKPKESARIGTLTNETLSGVGQTIDDIVVVSGDRLLIKNQTLPAENGIYIASAGAWSRSSDFNSASTEINGAYVPVQEGTTNAGKTFVQTGVVSTLDTDPVLFVFFNSVGILTGGDGIDVNVSNSISIDSDLEGFEFVANKLALDLDGGTLSKSITGVKVADSGIDTTQLNDSSVTNTKVAANAITELKIANTAVTETKIQNSAVTTDKLNDDAVTAAKLNPDVAGDGLGQEVGGELKVNVDDSTIETNADTLRVKDAGITAAKLNSDVDAQVIEATHTPLYYTPDEVATEGTGKVSAHLKGIDNEILTLNDTITAVSSGQNFKGKANTISGDSSLYSAINGTILSTLLPFIDDEVPHLVIGDFADGDIIIAANGIADRLLNVYDDAGTLKLTDVGVPLLKESDTYYLRNDLIDSPGGQENSALYNYTQDGIFVKTADIDFSFADGIDLSPTYTQAVTPSDPLPNDSTELAISKLHASAIESSGFILDLQSAVSENTEITTVLRNCLVGASVGDLVMESASVANTVDITTNNVDSRPIIGVIVEKPTTTTARIASSGTVTGLSGLSKGDTVFLSASGTITSTVPVSGYIQYLGVASEIDEVNFQPSIIRVKRN